MNGVLLVGFSHKTSSLELRERCARLDQAQLLQELAAHAGEAALISTCNRFEIYTHGTESAEPILQWLAGRAGLSADELAGICYVRRGVNACKHLFFVSSSLDSLVVGETQIRGQVKQAYRAAHEAGGVGPVLHRLFQTALRVSKEVAERTGVGRGNVSVAGAAADLASRVFRSIEGARVLVLGAGETAELVVTHLASREVGAFRILNRTAAHAEELAARCGGRAGALDQLEEFLPEADVVVCAAPGEPYLIAAKQMRKAVRKRRGRPIVVVDIAVPRGVDPAVDRIDNVYRYDMDTLTAVTQDALRHRRAEFIQCCTLIDAASLQLAAGTRALRAGDTIAELEHAYERVALEELRELEAKLPPEARERVRRSIRRIVKRLLHQPKRALREGSPEDSAIIRRVFTGKDKR